MELNWLFAISWKTLSKGSYLVMRKNFSTYWIFHSAAQRYPTAHLCKQVFKEKARIVENKFLIIVKFIFGVASFSYRKAKKGAKFSTIPWIRVDGKRALKSVKHEKNPHHIHGSTVDELVMVEFIHGLIDCRRKLEMVELVEERMVGLG